MNSPNLASRHQAVRASELIGAGDPPRRFVQTKAIIRQHTPMAQISKRFTDRTPFS
jgi:hypothetical protein